MRNAVLPPQAVSPHCFFRTNISNQEKSGGDAERDSSQVKPSPSQFDMATKPVSGMAMDMNTNPYYQPLSKVDPRLNEQIAFDAKLLQAQSQMGAINSAAVAVVAHRQVGAVQFGMS